MNRKTALSLLALAAVLLLVGAWLLYPGAQLTERRLQTLNDLLDGAVVTADGNFPSQGFIVISPQGYQALEQEPQLRWRLSRMLEEERIIVVLDVCCEDFFGLIPGADSTQLQECEESRRHIRALGITLRGGELLFKEKQISRRYSVSRLAAAIIDFAISVEETAQQAGE